MEDEEQDDEDDLVEELTPTLHQESARNLAPTVESIVLGGDLAGAYSILHTRSRGHGVLSTDADAVEEEGPSVADDPTFQADTPRCSQHEQADEHDGSILDKTPSTTEVVTKITNEDLTFGCVSLMICIFA